MAERSYPVPEASFNASRQRVEEIAARERKPTASELVETYAPKPGENLLYGELLREASEGRLDFDPVENVLAFADAADRIDPATGKGAIEIPVDRNNTTNQLSRSAAKQLIQQIRLARSLGFQVEGDPYIENGLLKVNIATPRYEGDIAYPQGRNGELIEDEPLPDGRGGQVPAEVAASVQAGLYYDVGPETLGIHRPSMRKEMEEIIQNAQLGFASHVIQHEMVVGGVAYRRALAEALGYKTGSLQGRIENGKPVSGHYTIPIDGSRPGFER